MPLSPSGQGSVANGNEVPDLPVNCRPGRACVTGWPTACRDHLRLFARRLGGKGSTDDRDSFDIANGVPEQPCG